MTWRRVGSSTFRKHPEYSGAGWGWGLKSSSLRGLGGGGALDQQTASASAAGLRRRCPLLGAGPLCKVQNCLSSKSLLCLFLCLLPSLWVGAGGRRRFFTFLGKSYKNFRKLFLRDYRAERFGGNTPVSSPQPGFPGGFSDPLSPSFLPTLWCRFPRGWEGGEETARDIVLLGPQHIFVKCLQLAPITWTVVVTFSTSCPFEWPQPLGVPSRPQRTAQEGVQAGVEGSKAESHTTEDDTLQKTAPGESRALSWGISASLV